MRLLGEEHSNQRAPGLRPQNQRHSVCSRKSRKAGGLLLEESQRRAGDGEVMGMESGGSCENFGFGTAEQRELT